MVNVIKFVNIEFVAEDEQHESEFDESSDFVNEDDNGQTDVSDESDNETEAEYN